jgi:hypothetical protein
MAGVKVKYGPPFNAMKSWSASLISTVMAFPAGPGLSAPQRMMLPTLESLKMAV